MHSSYLRSKYLRSKQEHSISNAIGVTIAWIGVKTNSSKLCIAHNWPRVAIKLYDITFIDNVFVAAGLNIQIQLRIWLL